FHYERAYLKAIGERYDPQAVRAAAQQAETSFAEALRRQPDNSVALVNWGAIKAESALFFSIESGAVDRSRLQGAQALFNRAEGQLQQRQDRDGQIALGMGLLYDATCLPPDANLEAIQWAARRTESMRREFPPEAAGAIQWEMVQRNWARRDARFFDEEKIKRARQILTAAGAAALLLLLEEWQTAHAAMLQQIAQWGGSGFGGQPPDQPPADPLKHAGKAARTLSRRSFLLRAGIGGGAVIVAGGAAAIAARAGVFSPPGTGNATPTLTATPTPSPTPTPAPGATLATHRQNGGITGLAWSPVSAAALRQAASRARLSGNLRVASASQDGTVQVWEASSGNLITTYSGHKGAVLAVAWSPDGSRIASAGAERTVQIWDPATGNELGLRNDLNQPIQALAWSPTSQQLAIGGANGLTQVIDPSGKLLFPLEATGFLSVFALDWSRDGQFIVGGGGYPLITLGPGGGMGVLTAQSTGEVGLAAIWDSASGRPLSTYSGHATTVRTVAWSPDSKFVASGSDDTTAQVWQPGSKTAANIYKNHTGAVNSVSWSPDALRVVSGSADQTAQVWGAADGALSLT
ncbi:MAG TPA: WD40 repeat domain-containing protein, partial [Ktedonobacterales bacterium]